MGEIAERLRNSKTANFDDLLEIADDVEILEDEAKVARAEVKEAVEEWFSNVDLTDLFTVKGWS